MNRLLIGVGVVAMAAAAFAVHGRITRAEQRVAGTQFAFEEAAKHAADLQQALNLRDAVSSHPADSVTRGLPTSRSLTLNKEEERLASDLSKLNIDSLRSAKVINAWIYASIKSAEIPDPANVLSSMGGQCGDRDNVFSNIMESTGTPSRRISFFNVPIQLGHTATEFFINNRWRFFDSTAGIFFSFRGSLEPISIAEARAAYPNIDIWQANTAQWSGEWQEVVERPYRKFSGNYFYDSADTSLPVIDIERTYFASEMAGSPEEPIYYSNIVINSKLNQKISFGKDDNSSNDLPDADGELYAPLLERIGRYGSLLTGTRFVFVSNVNRKATVKIKYINKTGNIVSDLDHRSRIFGLKETAIKETIDGRFTVYEFDVKPPSSVFYLWARGNGSASVDQIIAGFEDGDTRSASTQ